MQNPGKIFEEDIQSSVPETCWIYRLKDNASVFSGGTKTRFTSNNICDFIMLDDWTQTLFLLELKSTKSTSLPLSMIRENQEEGLLEASKHKLIAGFIVNFRNENNDTFFLEINLLQRMTQELCKKSFNIKDLLFYGAVRIDCFKKRTRYRYDIEKMIHDIT